MSLIKSHSRSTNMSQQLCALTLMALILGYGTFAAPQLVMRPVNQAKEIGYQGKSGLPRPKIRRNTTFTSTKTQAHTSPGEPHGLERMWTKSWAQSASWTGLGTSIVAILWIYKLFFSREKHEKRVEINNTIIKDPPNKAISVDLWVFALYGHRLSSL